MVFPNFLKSNMLYKAHNRMHTIQISVFNVEKRKEREEVINVYFFTVYE
jgi:hypothetical protein